MTKRTRQSTVHLARARTGDRYTLCGVLLAGCGGSAQCLPPGDHLDAVERLCSRCEVIRDMDAQKGRP